MKSIRTDSRKYTWYGRKPFPRRSIPRMKEEIGKVQREVMAWRYPPFNYWFESEASLHEWFEAW